MYTELVHDVRCIVKYLAKLSVNSEICLNKSVILLKQYSYECKIL